jgi:hypothetical protein
VIFQEFVNIRGVLDAKPDGKKTDVVNMEQNVVDLN